MFGKAWVRKTVGGLSLEAELTVADYCINLGNCEVSSRKAVRTAGIDIAPANEFIGVSFDLNEDNSACCDFVNQFFGFDNPVSVWGGELSLILDDLTKAEVGSFVLVPKQAVFHGGIMAIQSRGGKLLGSTHLAEWLGLSECGLASVRFDTSKCLHRVLTGKEVLDKAGRLVRREVPYDNPIEGLQPGDCRVGNRGRSGFSKVLCGLRLSLLLRLFCAVFHGG